VTRVADMTEVEMAALIQASVAKALAQGPARQDRTIGARVVSVRECARILRVDAKRVRQDVRNGRLPANQRGKTIWVNLKRAESLYGA
jgi:hypothetical protein